MNHTLEEPGVFFYLYTEWLISWKCLFGC